jgi:hypothetical protein
VSRPDILDAYNALPAPTTRDEAWRFTDLKGFDPESFTASGEGTTLPRLVAI